MVSLPSPGVMTVSLMVMDSPPTNFLNNAP